MHHVGKPLHHELLGDFDAADFRHAPDVVAAEVDEHQVLGELFGIVRQLPLHRHVVRFVAAAAPGAGQRPMHDHAVFEPRQDFRRRAHDVKFAQVHEHHVGRRIKAPQRPGKG